MVLFFKKFVFVNKFGIKIGKSEQEIALRNAFFAYKRLQQYIVMNRIRIE